MKIAAFTFVAGFALAATLGAQGNRGLAETSGRLVDAGLGAIEKASAFPALGKRERLAASVAPIEIAQADQPKVPGGRATVAQSAVEKASPAETPDKAASNAPVDESALRYFARKGDKVRLQAEIERLRALHPDWVPPTDPLAIPDNIDQQLASMWKLFSESRYADVRKAIADRQSSEPGWKPPADLLGKLDLAETRQKLVAASDARRHDEVVDLGARAPALMTCDNVDILWRVAEAFGNTARQPRALDAYGYILDNCTKETERRATVMKAAALLDYGQMQSLLAKEKKSAEGVGEFEPVRDDLARRFVAEGGMNANLAVAPVYLDRVKQLIARDGKPSDALLLGWYHVKRKQMTEAEPFFREAREIEDSASASQGLALTLIASGNPREAENVMYKWRASSKESTDTYFAATANLLAAQPPTAIAPEVLRRVSAAATEKQDIKTAENFGWYALAFQQPRTAAQWFRTTLGWKPDHEPAAYGLTVARLRLKDTAGVKQMQTLWGQRSKRIATITERPRKRAGAEDDVPSPDSATTARPDLDGSGTQSIDQPDGVDRSIITRSINKPVVVAQATARPRSRGCGTSIDPSTLKPGAALDRGWCLMQLNRPMEAAAAFEVALRSNSQKTRKDAAYGQSLAYLRAGLVDQAAVSATRAKQDTKRATELQTAILADRAINAFDAGRPRETLLYLDQLAQLQSERADLMVLRAYAYRKLNRKSEALQIFEALAATGNRDAIKGLGSIRQEDSPK